MGNNMGWKKRMDWEEYGGKENKGQELMTQPGEGKCMKGNMLQRKRTKGTK